MAGIPQFMPEGSPSEVQSVIAQAGNAASSWMTQANERQIRTQQEQRQAQAQQMEQKKFLTMLPALIAKANADRAVDINLTANAVAEQKFRKDALDQLGPTTNEYTEILKIGDYSKRADALAALQAKSAWLGQVPETKALAGSINNSRVRAEHEVQLDATLKNGRYVADQANDRVKYGADQRLAASLATSSARVQALESASSNAGGHDATAINTALIREYGEAATRNEVAAEQQQLFNPEQADAMRATAKDLRSKMQKLATQALSPQTGTSGAGGNAASTSPATKVVPIEKKPYVIDTKAGTFAFTDPKLKPEGQKAAVKAAIDAGDITEDQGVAILRAHGWGASKPASAAKP